MERIDSFEGKLFYKIYMLCQKNQINEEQKGKLKDLVILRDERIEIAMNQYLEDRDEFRLLENFHNYSGEEYSPKSYNNFQMINQMEATVNLREKGLLKCNYQKDIHDQFKKVRCQKLQQRDTDVTTCSKGFLLSTARSSDNRKALAFNERYTQQNWSECE